MNTAEGAAWAQALFGFFTFLAAGLAVKAAYDAPKRAAEFAEALRQESQIADERRRVKLNVLTTLLQHRATFEYAESVNALNLITIAFVDDQEVRDAYTHFLGEADKDDEAFNLGALRERYLSLIEKIVRNVGLSERITVADVHQGYYPKFLEKHRILANWELEQRLGAALATVQSDQVSSPAVKAAPKPKWPARARGAKEGG